MYPGKLVRYVSAELLKVFALATVGLTIFMVLITVGQEVLREGLGLLFIARLIPYALPNALIFAVPATVLLSACVVFGRLSADNEIAALESLGISPVAIMQPALIAAFILSVMTVWLIDIAFSWGYAGMQRVVCESIDQIAYGVLRTKRSYSTEQFSIAVASVDGKRLVRPVIRFHQEHGEAVEVTAREGTLHVDESADVLKISLTDGIAEVEGRAELRFRDRIEHSLPLVPGRKGGPHPSHMRLAEVGAARTLQVRRIAELERTLAADTAFRFLTGDFALRPGGVGNEFNKKLKSERRLLQRLKTEPYRRWASGFSCLAFAFVGVPIAIRFKTADFVSTFALCFLPILLAYYPLFMFALDRAKVGALPPPYVWTGNLICFGIGGWLLRRYARY